MKEGRAVHLLGFASAIAGAGKDQGKGPLILKDSPWIHEMIHKGVPLQWGDILQSSSLGDMQKSESIAKICHLLAKKVNQLMLQKKFFTVLGGDHSSAIGTWSGAYEAIKSKGPLGLIWIDAHMDSHTMDTTPSGNFHGMPLACLLGRGLPSLTKILSDEPKLKPEHVCLVGVRSYEDPEARLLQELNVKVFFMEEVKERGLEDVIKECIKIVTSNTHAFGISFDIDSVDPKDAPATGVSEPNGISANDICKAFVVLSKEPKFIGAEIVEFFPELDEDHKTEKLIAKLLAILALYNEPRS